jgi:tripartite-type tricarboxylate transporter receptor subunit TctC
MKRSALRFIAVCLFSVLCLASAAAYAADGFPSKNITWLVPSKAGGGYDIYARAVGRQMQKYLPNKVDFIYMNLDAAGGVESLTKLYNAKPDGYTIGYVKVPGSIVSQMTLDFAKYDCEKIAYIGNITTDHDALVVKKDSPINSLKDLKAKGTVKFSTTGVGATSWVNTVVMTKEVGITPRYVHYTNTADAMLSVIRGDTDALLVPFFSTLQYASSGDVKLILLNAASRAKQVPDVPTIAEEGYPGLSDALSASRLIGCPPNTPLEVMNVLEDAFWKAVNDPELLAALEKAGFPIMEPCKGADAKTLVQACMGVFEKYKADLAESVK